MTCLSKVLVVAVVVGGCFYVAKMDFNKRYAVVCTKAYK